MSLNENISLFIRTFGYMVAVDQFSYGGSKEEQDAYVNRSLVTLLSRAFPDTQPHKFNDRYLAMEKIIAEADKDNRLNWFNELLTYTLRLSMAVDFTVLREAVEKRYSSLMDHKLDNLWNVVEGTTPILTSDARVMVYYYILNREEITLEQLSYGNSTTHNPVNGKPHLLPLIPPPLDPAAGKP